MIHLAWIVPLVLLIIYVSSPRFRGDIAETRVRRILANGLEKNRYTILNDVVVPSGGGTVRIDHVVVSKLGIFVIESQYARGKVSGSEVQDRWKQVHLGRTTLFENPVHRNRLQAEALQALLDAPALLFRRIVVLTGHGSFRNGLPPGVVEAEQLIRHMRRKGEYRLDSEQAARALGVIESARLKPQGGIFVNRSALLATLLLLVAVAGAYFAFKEEIGELREAWSLRSEMKSNPSDFHPDGRPKSERELWEDSLRCASSPDTGRCACYEPGGRKADLDPDKCRELAERGSVLRQ